MDSLLSLLVACGLVVLVAISGVVFTWRKAGTTVERNLNYLISLSAGVFLAVSFGLGLEAIEHSHSAGIALAWILAGALLVWITVSLLPLAHHHHSSKDDHDHNHLDARRILISDSIHNIGDGIILAAAFSVSSALGIVTTISVLVHELVQEISEFFVLRQAGHNNREALRLNLLTALPIFIGALGGFFFLDTFHELETPILGLAAGALLVVVLHDLIPHSIHSADCRGCVPRHIMWFVVGLLLMSFVLSLFSHEVEIDDLATRVYHVS